MLAIHSAREAGNRSVGPSESCLCKPGMRVWELVTQDEMVAASLASFHYASSEAFAATLNRLIRPVLRKRGGAMASYLWSCLMVASLPIL